LGAENFPSVDSVAYIAVAIGKMIDIVIDGRFVNSFSINGLKTDKMSALSRDT